MTVDVGATPLRTAVRFCIENDYLGGEKHLTRFTLTNRDAEVLNDTVAEMLDEWTRAEPVKLRSMGIRLKPDFKNNGVRMSFSLRSDSCTSVSYSSGSPGPVYAPGLSVFISREDMKCMCSLIEKAILQGYDMLTNNREYFAQFWKVSE